jgi:hypothetical protein
MRAIAVLGIVTALTGFGCASVDTAAEGAERDFSGFARRANPSLYAGQARVVDARIRPALSLQNPQASRAQLEGGSFVVCWTRGSIEEGRRALAQAFKADGSPLGAPVVISPPDVDVVGAPNVVATDAQHVVTTFAAASETSMDLLAVPIETQSPAGSGERSAHR